MAGADEDVWVTIPPPGVKSVCQKVGIQEPDGSTPVYVAQLGASSHCVPDVYACPTHMELKSLELMSRASLKTAEAIGPAIKALQSGCWPSEAGLSPEFIRLKREAGKLAMKERLLHRYSKRSSGETVSQLVLPKEFCEMVMRAMHDDFGHLGQERTVDLLRCRFFSPRMLIDVEAYIKNCGECVTHKTPVERAAPSHQIISHGPMDLVCMDFIILYSRSEN